jgi:TetR/AcrR family transcriptional regulator
MSTKTRREREKEQRRNEILDAAEELFLSKGYDNVHMDEIAREVELGKATLYLYFENKEALFFSTALRALKMLVSMASEGADKETKGMKKIYAYRKAYYDFIKMYPDHSKILSYSSSVPFDRKKIENKDLKGKSQGKSILAKDVYLEIIKTRKKLLDDVYASIEIGRDDGTIRSDIDPIILTILTMIISEGFQDMNIEFKHALTDKGVKYKDFLDSVMSLVGQMIASDDYLRQMDEQ